MMTAKGHRATIERHGWGYRWRCQCGRHGRITMMHSDAWLSHERHVHDVDIGRVADERPKSW